MTTPSQMPESLKVVAWRKHLSGAEWKLADYVLPDSEELVRLADAEAALKDRDAEIERLKKDAERYAWLCDTYGETMLPCMLEPRMGDYVADGKDSIDAAIDSMKGGAT